ncbi:MAG: radical SAM protein [Planctomycetes bacterium]|nr:radical SAM protein [Planctomycetota bacterium]
MPTSLLAAATIILNSGIDVSVSDENIETHNYTHPVIGINLLGPPYIPTAIAYTKFLQSTYNKNFLLIIGGQVASGLSAKQHQQLFGSNTINGNKVEVLMEAIGAEVGAGKKISELSLIPAYSQLSDKYMRLYLNTEFGFYLSQGCKYACSFCTASRSIHDPINNKVINNKEIYRNLDVAYNDMRYLVNKAIGFGIKKLDLYLSNLDLFQNPANVKMFAERIIQLRKNYPGFSINMRALSNVRSFLKVHKSSPEIILQMIEAGLYRIGFGIDGATPEIWKETRKPQTKSECIKAMVVSKNEYNLITEMLMVFGYNKYDNEKSLQLAYDFSRDMSEEYGALIRPHIAKDIAPGNDGWRNKENEEVVNRFIKNPVLFQNLDFTAIPSPYTHPDGELRKLITKFYKKICQLPSSLTQYVKPETTDMAKKELSEVRKFNLMKYDI